MLVKKMGLPWITVSDLQAAKKFYVEVMGFELFEENLEANWLEVKCGESLIGIWQALPNVYDKPGQNAVLTFTVENIENTKRVLESQGIKFLGDIVEIPGVFRVATYVDADNNKFQLYQSLLPA